MIPTFTLEPTKENIEYVEKVCDLYQDHSLGHLTDEGLENELQKLTM